MNWTTINEVHNINALHTVNYGTARCLTSHDVSVNVNQELLLDINLYQSNYFIFLNFTFCTT